MMNMTPHDAMIRLDLLKDRNMPLDTPGKTASPVYNRAYADYLSAGTVCNALKEGSDAAGGYLVPDEFEHKLIQALEEQNVLRRISSVVTTTHDLKIPVALGIDNATWVPEGAMIPVTEGQFGSVAIGAYKLATAVLCSDELLEDAGFDVEAYIAEAFSHRLGTAEEEAMISGDGKAKPLGLLKQVETGTLTEDAGSINADDLLDLILSVPAGYRKKGVFLMNDATEGHLRKIKLYHGRSIWEDDMERDVPTTLLGYPVIICKSMPDVASGNTPILFGDFQHYLIGDRGHRSIKRLNERYADHGQVGFYISQRMDARLIDRNAIKSLKVR